MNMLSGQKESLLIDIDYNENDIDRSRGKHINDCIISLEFGKKEYEELYLRNADGEEVIRRVGKNIPTDFIAEPLHVKPIYDSGILNVYYVK